ncbi:MAG: hypothetical protein IGR92_09185 [Leptolyngbyaceae cyanobacterium T60_A2020_046]|nr:hypothetical protein [Leptolyngbyaceae cyanobacterium T60_A2020_046]
MTGVGAVSGILSTEAVNRKPHRPGIITMVEFQVEFGDSPASICVPPALARHPPPKGESPLA